MDREWGAVAWPMAADTVHLGEDWNPG